MWYVFLHVCGFGLIVVSLGGGDFGVGLLPARSLVLAGGLRCCCGIC